MNAFGLRQVRLLCLFWLSCRFRRVSGSILALCPLWLFSATCLGSETPVASQWSGTMALSIRDGTVNRNGDHRLAIVRVEPEGWEPNGFRYRIVLDSTSRGVTSALDLTAEEGGLRVIARDVDGAGDDLDLIIKSARSLAPVGVWLNDHRGGFTRVDPSAYAASIWNEGPLVLSDSPPNDLQAALVPSHQSCTNPPTRLCPFEPVADEILIKSTNPLVPSRLTTDPHQTRGPPSPPS